MKKTAKRWIITASFLVLIGSIIFGDSITMFGWKKYETNTYAVSDEFESISIKTDIADIVLVSSDDGGSRVDCWRGLCVRIYILKTD